METGGIKFTHSSATAKTSEGDDTLAKRVLVTAEAYLKRCDQRQQRTWVIDMRPMPPAGLQLQIAASPLAPYTKILLEAEQKTLTESLVKHLYAQFSSEVRIGVSYSKGGIVSIRRKTIDDYPSTSIAATCCAFVLACAAAGLVGVIVWYISLSFKGVK